MNIFASYPDPVRSANALDDKRVNKMITESAQMLSTAVHLHGGAAIALRYGPIYKPAYVDHPCTRWVRLGSNFHWLVQHAVQLNALYTNLHHRVHGAWPIIRTMQTYADVFCTMAPVYAFANCARNDSKGVDFTHVTDVHEAYRQYLRARWLSDARTPRWQNRDMPEWLTQTDCMTFSRNVLRKSMNNPNLLFLRSGTNGTNAR